MLGLFFSFLNGREQKDVYYSALLPIRKRDTVKANCLFVGLIELLALVIAVPFALLRAKLGIGDNPVGLNANVTLFACGLMLFAVFNAVFLLSFYRTAYKVGVSFVKACIVMAVAAGLIYVVVTYRHSPARAKEVLIKIFTWFNGVVVGFFALVSVYAFFDDAPAVLDLSLSFMIVGLVGLLITRIANWRFLKHNPNYRKKRLAATTRRRWPWGK